MNLMASIEQCKNPNESPEIIPGALVRVNTKVSSFPGIIVQRLETIAAVLIFPVASAYPERIMSGEYKVTWHYIKDIVVVSSYSW